jgi:hypothetical protein
MRRAMGMTPKGQRAACTLLGVVLVTAMGGTGCARSRPATVPMPVALNVPPPPPRVISTPPEPVAPTEATTQERATPVRPQRSTRPAVARNDSGRGGADAARTELPAEPAPTAAPEPVAAPTGPLLRTPQTMDEAEAERRTRDVLGRASGLLGRVKPEALATQARQQHDTARRFVEQAEQALLERNYVLASYLADKAETLAKGLSR